MKLSIYQIDAFSDKVFAGNPACVIPLEDWLPDELLLKIAAENAVAETAYFVQSETGIHLRWFTPDMEMDLCGHATLAAAYVLKVHLNYDCDTLIFNTLSGRVTVQCQQDRLTLDFPSRPAVPVSLPKVIQQAFSIEPGSVLKARDYLLIYPKADDVMKLQVNRALFDTLDLGTGGVIVTAPGDYCDFVSRFFTPQATILEDPVTGSAHCTLVPYWRQRLNKSSLLAMQLSSRGGTLYCKDQGSRVMIGGNARTYMVGHIWID
ncbi:MULTISPECIES: PhzF family phenazine biosynthesis protein [unclassified Carboxylicivirga]|uniref:PhzF family phenazine biosynthesis protein n=1 Tax=Carboxylicivirga TaxID=1628153 RepID=UPI003D35491C